MSVCICTNVDQTNTNEPPPPTHLHKICTLLLPYVFIVYCHQQQPCMSMFEHHCFTVLLLYTLHILKFCLEINLLGEKGEKEIWIYSIHQDL